MDEVQRLVCRAAELADGMTREEVLEGMAEVTGCTMAPGDLPADIRLAADGWVPARVSVRGGRVWVRGGEKCILRGGEVYAF